MSAVYKCIAQVASTMATKGVGKDRMADTGKGKYKFRGIDDFYNALAPELAAAGLCILPRCTAREFVERKSASGNALFYTTVTMEFDFVAAEDGSKHTVGPFYGEAMDSGDKGTNKAMSAAYKYCVMQAFAIPVEGQSLDSERETHEVSPKVLPGPIPANIEGKERLGNMTDEQQAFMREQAMIVMGLHKDGADLVGWVDAQHFDNEEKLALWYLLPSDVRSTFKKQQAAKRTPALATQA
jgi:hypothetical protein